MTILKLSFPRFSSKCSSSDLKTWYFLIHKDDPIREPWRNSIILANFKHFNRFLLPVLLLKLLDTGLVYGSIYLRFLVFEKSMYMCQFFETIFKLLCIPITIQSRNAIYKVADRPYDFEHMKQVYCRYS